MELICWKKAQLIKNGVPSPIPRLDRDGEVCAGKNKSVSCSLSSKSTCLMFSALSVPQLSLVSCWLLQQGTRSS